MAIDFPCARECAPRARNSRVAAFSTGRAVEAPTVEGAPRWQGGAHRLQTVRPLANHDLRARRRSRKSPVVHEFPIAGARRRRRESASRHGPERSSWGPLSDAARVSGNGHCGVRINPNTTRRERCAGPSLDGAPPCVRRPRCSPHAFRQTRMGGGHESPPGVEPAVSRLPASTSRRRAVGDLRSRARVPSRR